jgi:hypothetical protein
MGALDADRLHEGGDVVREQFHRIGAGRLVGLAGAARVDRNAGEMFGIVGDLKGVAGVVGREIRDEHERFARSLLLVVHADAIGLDLGHMTLPVDF